MNAKLSHLAACACVFVLSAAPAVHAGSRKVILNARSAEHPIFIPAEMLLTESGTFSPGVPEDWRERHHAYGRTVENFASRRATPRLAPTIAQAPCGGFELAESDVESLVFRDSVETTVGNAKAIFRGRIAEVTPGLFEGAPGSLLQLTNVTPLKTTPSYRNVQGSLSIRHPYSHFRVGSVEYCRATSGYVPTVGDEVIVFAFAEPMDEAGTFIYSYVDDIVAQSAAGEVYVPRLLEVFSPKGASLSAIAAQVHAHLRGAAGTRGAQ